MVNQNQYSMANNSGIIYDLGKGRYGLAVHKEQHPNFSNYGKVYLHVFVDHQCTVPEFEPGTGKKYVTLKDKKLIKAIGFSD
jgi:hypothetical protein